MNENLQNILIIIILISGMSFLNYLANTITTINIIELNLICGFVYGILATMFIFNITLYLDCNNTRD